MSNSLFFQGDHSFFAFISQESQALDGKESWRSNNDHVAFKRKMLLDNGGCGSNGGNGGMGGDDFKSDVKKAKLETKALKAKRPGFTDERYNETSYYQEPENGEICCLENDDDDRLPLKVLSPFSWREIYKIGRRKATLDRRRRFPNCSLKSQGKVRKGYTIQVRRSP